VPTSVLLAVLAAAGLLALAPALVRRYDATERLVAERALSTARVIDRRRRQRTVPGRRPINPPRAMARAMSASASTVPAGGPMSAVPVPGVPASAASPAWPAPASTAPVSAVSGFPVSAVPVSGFPVSAVPVSGFPLSARNLRRRTPYGRRPPVRAHTPAIYRRRRVLAALVLLNVIELVGVGLVGPGFSVGCALTGVLLIGYLVHLRQRAVVERRRRRAAARRAAWLAAREAQVRREQARRLAARREALRRAAAARAVAQREALRLSQRYLDGSVRARVRGRPYESRAAGY
jgi:hypothetical protein